MDPGSNKSAKHFGVVVDWAEGGHGGIIGSGRIIKVDGGSALSGSQMCGCEIGLKTLLSLFLTGTMLIS